MDLSDEKAGPVISEINKYQQHMKTALDSLFKLMSDKNLAELAGPELVQRTAAIYVVFAEAMTISALSDPRHISDLAKYILEFKNKLPKNELTEFEFRNILYKLSKDKTVNLDGGNC